MFNAATKTLVLALTLATFGTGCDLADMIGNIGGNGNGRTIVEPPVEPPVTPPVEDCEAELQQCLDGIDYGYDTMPVDGDYFVNPDEQACFDQFAVCIDDTPPPPVDDCELELEQCLDGAYGDLTQPANDLMFPPEVDCYELYAICLDDTQPPPPPVDDCEIELNECLDGIYADPTMPVWDIAYPPEEECFELYAICLDDTQPPPPPVDDCELELEQCLEDLFTDPDIMFPFPDEMPPIGDEEICFEQYAVCVDVVSPPPVDPCEDEFEVCLNSGIDPLTCELGYMQCWGIDDPYFQCEINLEQCLDSGLDPDVCFQDFDVCIDTISPPPPPVDGCSELFDSCLMNGVDPMLCEAVYLDCTDGDEPCDEDTEPGYPGPTPVLHP